MLKKGTFLTDVYLVLMPILYGVVFYCISPLESTDEFYLFLFIVFALNYMLLDVYKQNIPFKKVLFSALLSRLVLLFVPPNLSPDFYRFIWDGELLNMGINPYAHTPDDLISFSGFYDKEYMRMVYHGMTDLSKQHFSNYPVLNQLFFFIPTYFSNSIFGNVLGFKIIILIADIANIFMIKKILTILKIKSTKLILYALNPLVIIELVGNLHFEGVMIFFILCSIYFVINQKHNNSGWMIAGIFLSLAAQVKLIPLMFIPFFYKNLNWKKAIGFTAVVMMVFLIIGLYLWTDKIYVNQMLQSINDYFISFQFNSSVFSIINHYMSKSYGWNTTYIVGPLLSKISLVLIVLLALFRNYKSNIDVIKGILFSLIIYYILATTVHPWYITVVLVLSIFTNYTIGYVWSIVVVLSYFIYLQSENSGLIKATEYLILSIVLIRDLYHNKRNDVFGFNFSSFFKCF